MAKTIKAHHDESVSRLIENGDASDARAAINAQQAAEMRKAAKMIETSAYELAGLQPGNLIGRLIIIAADIERIAQSVETDAPLEPDPKA